MKPCRDLVPLQQKKREVKVAVPESMLVVC